MSIGWNELIALIGVSLLIVAYVRMLIHAFMSTKLSDQKKLVWLIVMILFPVAAVFYYSWEYTGFLAIRKQHVH